MEKDNTVNMSTVVSQVTENLKEQECIEVYGARVHNLQNIHVEIPRNKLVVITGLSGSGKSSLAFDTIYAEGQRRYVETFSSYARQFLGNLERPDVDKISGLSPVISIEQKSTSKNPRSTVGTITEIYDFLRLLYARVADAYSYKTGEKMVRYSENRIIETILENYEGKELYILSPIIKGRKGHYREMFEQIRKQGFLKVRVDGVIKEIVFGFQLDRYKIHDIEIVIDKVKIQKEDSFRLTESVKTAMKHGKGVVAVMDKTTTEIRQYSRFLMCPTTGISYEEPEPNSFSFNSPYGACPKCNGLGTITELDIDKIIPDRKKSISKGGIIPLGEIKNKWINHQLEAIGNKYGFDMNTPIEEISEHALDIILYGSDEVFKVKADNYGVSATYSLSFEGIASFIHNQFQESGINSLKKWAYGFMNEITCPKCNGSRLKKESLYFKIGDKNIADIALYDMNALKKWIHQVDLVLDERKIKIASELIKEIKKRVEFLLNVGLDYLSLNRPSKSLSGGESQRIRLATQIGSQLVGVLYILDEPSIGLHQRDNIKLIQALKDLRDIGNSVIVVEHDQEMILSSDYVVDIGPGAGVFGGKIVAQGSPDELKKFNTLTTQYLFGVKKIEIPFERRKGSGKHIKLTGASGNNLKNIDIQIPLGKMICVTGVSGSGKSTLINETLYPILSHHFYRSIQKPLSYKSIEGIKYIDKVIEVDQSPIGRTPRSNPITYIGVFDDIRKLFSQLQESKIRGYKPGRFSFNVKGGRCEECQGAGVKTIEMNFLPEVYVNCDVCNGKRYNRETLEVRYKGKSINDVLNMTFGQAIVFFEPIPQINHKLKAINEVGLSYITLGQPSTTLSGGEAQRVKLASELSKKDTGNTLYILDEPTTGLHFEDVRVLMDVLNKLVNKGNTVIIIEHNMEVIKMADHIIDIGPEGGERGGLILAEGTPEEIIKISESYTAKYLQEYLSKI
ncbi:MAG TPA: excinuclease ABC subunit UvrA [Bacteroidales bacterium]|nr:excinuclease ABC subunit UvrA [Bacteroidales bacterium]HQI45423.1 excinuclease ABC subunit UvrA [Bacteroidales bacterium]